MVDETCQSDWISKGYAAIINDVTIEYRRISLRYGRIHVNISYPWGKTELQSIHSDRKLIRYNPDRSGDYITAEWIDTLNTAVKIKVCKHFGYPVVPPYEPPIEPPVEPPYEPPIEPPVEPPYEPPIEPPVGPPIYEKAPGIEEKLVLGIIVAFLIFWSMG